MKINTNFKRFEYRELSQEIKDHLTGYIYHSNSKDLCELLNQIDERANRNAEKYYELYKERITPQSIPK